MKIIESIQYAPADQIVSWVQNKNTVKVQPYGEWISLPIYVASGELSYSSKPEKAGTQHTIQILARLKEGIYLPELLILSVKLCDGKILIIGTPDIPVQNNFSSTLYMRTISIAHIGINPPLISQEV